MEPQERTFTIEGRDGLALFTRYWPATAAARAVVQIAHGMGEHSARYARLAAALSAAGYHVYAYDHRGHGHTARSADELGHFGPDGWNALVADLRTVGQAIDTETGGLPRVILAHSMGSFALQQFVLDHSDEIVGAVLSGTSAVDIIASTFDPDAAVDLSALNAAFAPARTDSDWLSRDPDEVDKYVADPLCGFGVDAQATRDMAAGAPRLADPAALAGIRKDLPILLVSGSMDPLSGAMALVELVAQRYRDAGLTDVTVRGYADARHELFNETNRDEVTADVTAWLRRVTP